MKIPSILLVATLYFQQSAWAVPRDEIGLVLEQSSLTLGSQVKVEIATDWFKVNVPKQGYLVISKAPDWNTYFYRPDKRLYKMMTYAEVLKKSSLIGALGAFSPTTEIKLPSKHREIHRNGRVWYEYELENTTSKTSFLNEKMDREVIVVKDYKLIILQTNLQKQGSHILSRLNSLPCSLGIPYSLIGLRSDNSYGAALTTGKIRVQKLAKPDFASVLKYKKATKIEDILYISSPSQMFVDLVQ